MKTIAISRLIGSEAGAIAQRVTEVLGYDLVDKSVLQGTFQQYGLTRFGEVYTAPLNIWDLANSKNLQIVSMLNETMEALAHRGRTVILGRGGYASLNKYADVLHVRLQAPFQIRVKRVMAREGSANHLGTEDRVKEDDRSRQKFVEMFYNEKWDIASNFDLVIDTGTVSIQMAADWIVEAAKALDAKQFGADVVTAQRTKVDPLLLDAIDQALKRRIPSSVEGSK